MIYKCLIVACFIIFYLALVLPPFFNPTVSADEVVNSDGEIIKPYFLNQPFPNFLPEYAPTEWWNQQNKKEPENYPIFQLSQNYPKVELEKGKMSWEEPEFDDIFKTEIPAKNRWDKGKRYLIEVLKYAMKDNISLDGNIENDWDAALMNKNWFHAPWLHANKKGSPKDRGREFVHGLTAERCSCIDELNGKNICENFEAENKEIKNNACDNYPEKIQNWGVAVFNEVAGFNVGRVWKEMTVQETSIEYPKPSNLKTMGFASGSVIVKLLFTSASDEEAAFLKDSKLIWKSDVNRIKKYGKLGERETYPTLRLLQIDIAVWNKRPDSFTGWVFGTFSYNRNRNASLEIGKFDGWENVEPIGLMFGNDPDVNTNNFRELRQSLINPLVETTQHLGCGKRLNGAVDNPRSSCIACHAQQSEVQVSTIKNDGNDIDVNFTEIQYKIPSPSCEIIGGKLTQCDLSYWFKNVSPGKAFSNDTDTKKHYSLHNVLQFQLGITRYCDKNPNNCNNPTPTKSDKINKKAQDYPKMMESQRGRN
jgi:hypothetical protein